MSLPTPDKESSNLTDNTRILLSLMRALWGEVSPALRAALIKLENQTIHVYFFYDGEISDEDYESADCAATEVIASFPNHKLEVNISRLDYPSPLPCEIGELVYTRREKRPNN